MLIENFQNLVILLIYGSLIAQAFTTLINPTNVNRKANIFFGIFLFFWSSHWLLNIAAISQLPITRFLIVGVNCMQVLNPLFLYFSIIFFINPNYRFKIFDLICLVIPFIYVVALLKFGAKEPAYQILMFVVILHYLPYIAIAYLKIRRHQIRLQTMRSNVENINLQWLIRLLFLLLLVIVITVCYELYNALIYKMRQHVMIDLLFLGITYTTSYYLLRQQEVYPKDKHQRIELLSLKLDEEGTVEKKKLILDIEFETYRQKLLLTMEKDKPYLQGELNLLGLAELVDLNAHQLSYLINKGFNENFFQFVNKYRVEYAKELLLDKEADRYSLLGIAYESGFNSKTAFNTTFKKITKLTPSQFQKKNRIYN